MSDPNNPPHVDYVGVGFGLRWEFLDELLVRLAEDRFEAVPFFEVSPENYMRRGGYIPESLEAVAEHVPLITHGLMMSLGGLDPFEPSYFAALRSFVERFASPWHSDHLCFSGVDGRILHDLLPIPQTETAAWHVVNRVREARDRLGLPMAIENISYYLQLGHPDLEETELISLILQEADCGLLLDVNNVFVNAHNHGFDPKAWIARMDLSRVVQIHVAGHEHREDDGLIIDTHGAPMADPVFELLTWTVAQTGPVPVVLERDNNVPDLDQMLAEWRQVAAAYDAGIAQWGAVPPAPPPRRHEPAPVDRRLHQAQRVVDRAVRTTSDEVMQAELAAGFPDLELAAADAELLSRTDFRRVRVYRNLVRGNVLDAVANQLPRTVARLGRPAYERYVARYCETELPRSQILRDVAFELAAWATPLWHDDPEVAPYLPDLARYELLEFAVFAAERPEIPIVADELLADAPVAFDGSARLAAFEHGVHVLPDDPADTTLPADSPAAVLAYRDPDGGYHQLDLTPLATEILARLLLGMPFAKAVTAGCAARGTAVDAKVVEGTSKVLADLADRGVVLGAAAAGAPGSDPAPFFRWLMGPKFDPSRLSAMMLAG